MQLKAFTSSFFVFSRASVSLVPFAARQPPPQRAELQGDTFLGAFILARRWLDPPTMFRSSARRVPHNSLGQPFSNDIRSGSCCQRAFSCSSRVNRSETQRRKAPRMYRYVQDVHGQLFLHDTVPKNLTSCFKNPQFLDFFMARLKPNPATVTESTGHTTISMDEEEAYRRAEDQEADWTLDDDLTEEEAYRIATANGYHWISPCQGELNFVRCHASSIVFRDLVKDETNQELAGDRIRWAGGYHEPFQPHRLVVDA